MKAEVQQAVLCEGAQMLEDYWVRRSVRAWFDENAGLEQLAPAANEMAQLLNWSEAETQKQIDACLKLYSDSMSWRKQELSKEQLSYE